MDFLNFLFFLFFWVVQTNTTKFAVYRFKPLVMFLFC